jgi:hypothetical protein
MKFHFTKELTILNTYANIEVPMEELEKYFYDEDRDEESITEAARQWFDDNTWELEPTDDEVVETRGPSTAVTQETRDREKAEAIARWRCIQAAGPTMAK